MVCSDECRALDVAHVAWPVIEPTQPTIDAAPLDMASQEVNIHAHSLWRCRITCSQARAALAALEVSPDRVQIQSLLGSGQFGTVHGGVCIQLDGSTAHVAVKRLRPDGWWDGCVMQ